MLCPNCRYDNFEGEDSCVECGADLSLSDTPQALADYHDTILGDHLEALGIGSPTLVESTMPVAAAIRLMHEIGIDCLLVSEVARSAPQLEQVSSPSKLSERQTGHSI